jgi:mRNA interferase HigB
MRIISKRTLVDFWENHAASQKPLDEWFKFVRHADWENSQDIKNDFANASFLGDNRVVFNIGGNKFRLIVWVNYAAHAVYIKFIGTHAEYDKIDAENI